MSKRWKRSNEELATLMLLHGDREPDDAQIAALSDAEAQELEKYLVKSYLRASDNNVRVPPRPRTIDLFAKQEAQIAIAPSEVSR